MTRPTDTDHTDSRNAGGERGIAILMVLACLAVIMPFTASFNFKSKVDFQSAVNTGDEVRARNVQRGAVQLSTLMFELQRAVFNQKQFRDFMGTMDITQVAPYLMSIFGAESGGEDIGGLLGVDTSALNELSIGDAGSFEVRLEAESGKTNVNCIADPGSGKNFPRSRTVETLEALMQPLIYDPLFDEEKLDGFRYSRQDVLTAIVDYIDDDTKRFDLARLVSSSVGERYRYTELYDPYQPRNARLDSIEELHLVQGVDDDWMAAFGPQLTVYGGGCKVNMNFASAEQIALVLRHAVSANDRWKTEGENFMTMTMRLANFVVESREFNLFEKLEDVKELVAKPDQYVNPLTLIGGSDDPNAQDAAQNNLSRVPEGMEVRVNSGSRDGNSWGGLKDVATVSPERIYRIEVTTEVGAVRKRLTGVYDMQYVRTNSGGKGAWLYLRED